jgi:hypothetical protein
MERGMGKLEADLTRYLNQFYQDELDKYRSELVEEQLYEIHTTFYSLLSELMPVVFAHVSHNIRHAGHPNLDDVPEELIHIFKKNVRKSIHNVLNGHRITHNEPFSLTELIKLRRLRNRRSDPRSSRANEPRRNGLTFEQRRTRNQLSRGLSLNNVVRPSSSRRISPRTMYEDEPQQHNNLFKMLENLGPIEVQPATRRPRVRPPPSRRRTTKNRGLSLNRKPS